MTPTPLQAAVNQYVAAGFSLIPIKANDKRPAIGTWEPYQEQRPTSQELREWFGADDKNVAIVCGPVSGNLGILDIDNVELAEAMDSDVHLQASTTLVRTPRGGLHVYVYETSATSRSTPLVPGTADYKGAGGYVLAPPSSVNGRFYKAHTNGAIMKVEDGRKWAIETLRAFDVEVTEQTREPLNTAKLIIDIEPGNRNDSCFRLGCKLRASGYEIDDIAALVTPIARESGLDDAEIEALLGSVARYPAGAEPSSAVLSDPAVVVRLSDVKREEVSWLWSQRIPRGRLTGLMGDPGVGKSWVTLAIVTAVTLGAPLPEDSERREPKRALLLTAEDGLSDTVRPRLEDMGATLDNVTVMTAVRDMDGKEQFPDLSEHLYALDSELKKDGYELVVIDPINAFLGGDLDTHRDAAIRSVLGPLAQLAERHDVAILFVLHLNKGKRERAMYRAQGSIGYIGQARVMLMAGANPDNLDERALVWVKGNLSPPAESVGYEITEGRFAWAGESNLTAAHLLAPDTEPEEVSALEEAKAYLIGILADGPVRAQEILKAKPDSVSDRTLKRAKAQLGVKSSRVGGYGESGYWVCELPDSPKGATGPHSKDLAPLGESVPETDASASNVGPLSEAQQVGLRGASDTPEVCSVCADPDVAGYTSDGSPRCSGHYILPDDAPLVDQAVRLGGRIVGRTTDVTRR